MRSCATLQLHDLKLQTLNKFIEQHGSNGGDSSSGAHLMWWQLLVTVSKDVCSPVGVGVRILRLQTAEQQNHECLVPGDHELTLLTLLYCIIVK